MKQTIDRDKLIEILSDENLEREFPVRNESGTYLDINIGRRDMGRWLREKVLSFPTNTESRDLGRTTLEECMEEIAKRYNYNNWDDMIDILNQAGLNLLLEKRTNEAQDLYNTKQNNKPQYGFNIHSRSNDI